MSGYFVTGKFRNGKSLVSVARMFEYLGRGCKVATNLDIFLDAYLRPSSKKSVIRIPDKPSLADLEFIGLGNITNDETKNGLLVLDELGSWFNSRNWQDKERKHLIDWFIHVGKRGWDVILIVQDIDMVDGQLRGILGEHLVICRRMDRVRIPFIGKLMQMIGLRGMLPMMHRAKVYFGETVQDLHVDTWNYFGTQFYSAYNTKQIFSPSYAHGVFSYLSPWHTKGRFLPQNLTFSEKLQAVINDFFKEEKPVIILKPKHPLVARIMKLPCPEQRLEFFRRFEACHAFS